MFRLSVTCHKWGFEHALASGYHQFLATLLPGTKVYEKMDRKGRPLTDTRSGPREKIDRADIALIAGKVDTWLQVIADTAEKFEAEIERLGDND